MNRRTREEIKQRALVTELPPIGVAARLTTQSPALSGVIGKLDLTHYAGPKARLDLENGLYVWAAVKDLEWSR